VADIQYPDTGITEETRQMYTEKYAETFKSFVDEVLKPVAPIDRFKDNNILLDELVIMYEANLTVGNQQCRFNASVLRAAINVIKSIQ
jgi:hypothetical protein